MTDRQLYPAWRYHWTKPALIVNSLEEDAALGGGWANTPAAFDSYRDPKQARPQNADPLKWVDQWTAPVASGQRKLIRAQLLKAHVDFTRSPDAAGAGLEAMRKALNGIAKVLFDGGALTERLLENEIPELVWDSAVAAGWWPFASEQPERIFPERIGHYFIWRENDSQFTSEIAEWKARLWEAEANNPLVLAPANHSRESEAQSDPHALSEETQPKRQRQRGTIESPIAARRMEAYLKAKGLSKADFASLVGTTDRTLRNFSATGILRRDIMKEIARQMGISLEDLIKQ